MGEKSSFLATCNLLNQFLKQKGSLSDLVAARASESKESSRPRITMSLLANLEVTKEDGSQTKKERQQQEETLTEPVDLFPGFPVLKTTENQEEKREQKKAQLTIFYSGKVVVFDDIPEDRAKDLIDIAGRTSSAVKDFALSSTSTATVGIPVAADKLSTSGICVRQDSTEEQPQKPAQANTSNMRVARRASLHKFLEKRKDRISTKAPYQLNESQVPQPQKSDDNRSWLGFGEPSKPSSSNEMLHKDQD